MRVDGAITRTSTSMTNISTGIILSIIPAVFYVRSGLQRTLYPVTLCSLLRKRRS
jgi:hypothetical protein